MASASDLHIRRAAVSSPVVAIISPAGDFGQNLAAAFAQAAKEGLFSLVKLVTSNPQNPVLQEYSKIPPEIVRVIKVDYYSQASFEDALDGVDIVVSAMGLERDQGGERNLIRAAAKKGVKVYLPSEWGMDYPRNTAPHPIFTMKQNHLDDASQFDFKIVNVCVGYFLDMVHIFGYDENTRVWDVPGDGNQLVAFSTKDDVAQYAIRASLLAFEKPDAIPSRIRVFSDIVTWNTFLAMMEARSGEKIERKYTPLDRMISEYNMAEHNAENSHDILALMCAQGLQDYSNSSDNELLNPGKRFFKPKSIEEFAAEVGGKPWPRNSHDA